MLRNGDTGDWIGTFDGHKGAVWSAALNGPATHAATGSADFSARVWDAISGDELFNFAHKHIVRTVRFSQDSKRLLTGGYEKSLRIFDLMSPDVEPLKYDGWEGPIRNAAWLHDDRLVVLACSDMKDVRVFDLRAGQAVTVLETAGVITDLQVREGVLTVAAGKQMLTWDATSFAPLAAHTLDFEVFTAATCVAKKRFVAGGPDMWPRLYSAEGAELETFKGHHGPVHSIEFHPSGESFASGSEDGTIRLWSSTPAAESAEGDAAR